MKIHDPERVASVTTKPPSPALVGTFGHPTSSRVAQQQRTAECIASRPCNRPSSMTQPDEPVGCPNHFITSISRRRANLAVRIVFQIIRSRQRATHPTSRCSHSEERLELAPHRDLIRRESARSTPGIARTTRGCSSTVRAFLVDRLDAEIRRYVLRRQESQRLGICGKELLPCAKSNRPSSTRRS